VRGTWGEPPSTACVTASRSLPSKWGERSAAVGDAHEEGARIHADPHGAHLADGVAASLDAAALWPRVSELITELPDGERDALLLFMWEQLSYEEIAASLEIPIGTVRSRLNRVRRRLRALDAPMEVMP